MTLSELQQQTLEIIDESSSPTVIKNITNGLNYAYRKIAKDKFNTDITNLVNADDEPTLDFDHMVLCFFAAYFYFKIDGDTEGKAGTWLGLFNDGMDGIYVEPTTVTSIYVVDELGG